MPQRVREPSFWPSRSGEDSRVRSHDAHSRRVHVLIVGEDLKSIAHVHPEDFGAVTADTVRSGRYSVTHAFPRAGRYLVGVDVMSSEGALAKQFIVTVAGPPPMGAPEKDLLPRGEGRQAGRRARAVPGRRHPLSPSCRPHSMRCSTGTGTPRG